MNSLAYYGIGWESGLGEGEGGQDGIVVREFGVAAAVGHRGHVAAIEDVVDVEKEAVGVIGRGGA